MTERNKLNATYSRIYYYNAIYHGLFVIIFMLAKCPVLMFLNVASIFFYLILGRIAFTGKGLKGVFNACFWEIVVFSALSSLLAGWNSGFQYYGIAILPLVFYSVYWLGRLDIKLAFKFTGVIVAVFFACMFLSFAGVLRIYTLSHALENALHVINSAVCLVVLIGFLVVFVSKVKNDTRELVEEKHTLESSANLDALTGLLNRRTFDEYLSHSMHDSYENGHSFSILMCDIDDFKNINDTYGHECGDMVLKTVANTLIRSLRDRDRIFRWGGEEILILLADDSERTGVIAERCRKAVSDAITEYKGVCIRATVTIGCCSYFPGATKDDMINAADRNLYQGKNTGKNRVVT